jgi:hypothetical protein
MPPSTFSGPELFLLRKWTNARLLEDSMKAVRQKYSSVLEKVLDIFQDQHDELDSRDIRPTNDGVNIGIGKKTWRRTKPNYYISGFWIGEIRIEDLTSEEEDSPDKTVLVNHPDVTIDLDAARKKLRDAAKSILSKEELRRADLDWGKGIAGITYPIMQPRAELFELLITDDSRSFVSCVVAHLESMVKFTSIVDEIFKKG